MSSVAAKYIITAEDRSKAAIEAAKKGFADLDNTAKRLAKGLKGIGVAALGLQALRASANIAAEGMRNLAEQNVAFAKSVGIGEEALKRAKSAGGQAMVAQLEYNKALADPATQAALQVAHDAHASYWLGIKTWITEAHAAAVRFSAYYDGTKLPEAIDPATLGASGPGRSALASKLRDLGDVDAARVLGSGQNKAFDERMKAQADAAKEAAKAAKEAAKAAKEAREKELDELKAFNDLMVDMRDEAYDLIADGYDEEVDRLREHYIEPSIKAWQEAQKQVAAAQDEMTVYSQRAAENMQDAFADFLFDPFEDGLKGMLSGFLNVIRRMIAEQAAAKIFGSKASGGLGFGDLVSGAMGSLFGFANGGSFKVGGSGGTDSQLVAFKASPNETVSVTKPGQQAGRATIIHHSPVIHLNAAQLTQDQAARMVADSQRRMFDELDRRYGIA